MFQHPSTDASALVLFLLASACSANAPPANVPASPPATASNSGTSTPPKTLPQAEEGVSSPKTTGEPDAQPAAPPETTAKEEPLPQAAPTAHPLDVLTGRETAFLIDYANSGADAYARKTCELATNATTNTKEGDEDAKRKNLILCLQKERTKFTADVLRFRKDERGHGTLTIYRRVGSSLPEVYVAKVEYKEIDSSKVQVKVKGGLSGARPICRDKSDLEVLVPTGYSIELVDPVYGKLTYEAKIGLVAN